MQKRLPIKLCSMRSYSAQGRTFSWEIGGKSSWTRLGCLEGRKLMFGVRH